MKNPEMKWKQHLGRAVWVIFPTQQLGSDGDCLKFYLKRQILVIPCLQGAKQDTRGAV